jgi:ribulose-phosphate 3-epimerase
MQTLERRFEMSRGSTSMQEDSNMSERLVIDSSQSAVLRTRTSSSRFADAGSDSFVVHREGNANLHRRVQRIKTLGKRAGVVINPATPAAVLEEILQDIEQVLIMTVNPGFGHQHFIPTTLPKIRRVRELIEQIKGGAIWRWTGHRCRNGSLYGRSRSQCTGGRNSDFRSK